MNSSKELRLFISYSHSDQNYLDALMPTLKKCQRQLDIIHQTDREIPKGVDWNRWIINAISTADIILCLISTEYLASEYIIDTELPLFRRRYDEGVPIIPIYVRYSRPDSGSILYTAQGLNSPNKPISNMSDNEQDRFFAAFENDLDVIAKEIRRKREWPLNTVSASDNVQPKSMAKPNPKNPPMTSIRYNIAVVGRTGVGKSALINYLFGSDICTSATGKPVTKRGFHRQVVDIGGVPCTLFDSWGLEISTADDWLQDLEEELADRSIEKPVAKWFHTIIYCIQASGHRVEPFDVEILRRFRRDRYRVIIALTKADAVSRKALSDLDSTVRGEVGDNVPCVPVCSVAEETLSGKTTRFGLTNLVTEIQLGFWESIMDRVPARCVSVICKYIDNESDNIISFVRQESGYFNQKAIASKVRESLSKLVSDLTKDKGIIESMTLKEIEYSLKMYKEFEKVTKQSLHLQTVESGRHLAAPDFATLPDGSSLKGLLTVAGSSGVGIAISLISSLGIFPALSLGLSGPIGLGFSVLVLASMKDGFVNDMIKKIKGVSKDIKKRVKEIEPELKQSIGSARIT